jgi:hypothetical protein
LADIGIIAKASYDVFATTSITFSAPENLLRNSIQNLVIE